MVTSLPLQLHLLRHQVLSQFTAAQFTSNPALSEEFFKCADLPLVRSQTSDQRGSSGRTDQGMGNSKPLFSYEELVIATGGFSTDNLLGQGGFGSVYKGTLPDGRVVAVKQLKAGGGQGEREFRAELESISRIHHRHLVSLVGYCISEQQRLLVYDYVPNNTLNYHLHSELPLFLDQCLSPRWSVLIST